MVHLAFTKHHMDICIHNKNRYMKVANNTKQTSKSVASKAAQTLNNPNASAIQKSLAGSALAQSSKNKQTGKAMEAKASAALDNPRSADLTKSLAGTVVSQSNKKR